MGAEEPRGSHPGDDAVSASRRRAKAARQKAWWAGSGIRNAPSKLELLLLEMHTEAHPGCEWGFVPHYCPPALGDEGFFLCDRGVLKPLTSELLTRGLDAQA